MPSIKIDHVVSFSSEDPVHNASNILSTDTSKKWKCQTSGEKQAIVVLQLEKASQITAIDIGNEHSAYVEVLVSRSGNNDDFKVLLVTSAFMTPLESRQSQNINKVRMFTKDQLSKPECDEKWDRVKIVCTQPFNRHVQFGLSFVSLHSNVSKESESNSQLSIGKFTIRPESPDNLSIGALFAKRKELKQDEKPTAAAAIRDAASSSSLAMYGSPTCKPKLKNKDPDCTAKKKAPQQDADLSKPTNRNRDALFYTSDDEENNDKIDKIMKKKEEEDLKRKEKEENEKNDKKRKNFWGASDDDDKKKKKDSSNDDNKKKKNDASNDDKKKNDLPDESKIKKRDKSPSGTPKRNDKKDKTTVDTLKLTKPKDEKRETKRKTNDNLGESSKPKKAKFTKPFHELLSGVTLVISGIQNPDRGVLRTMALSMGAKYKPDWDSTCTHLICAFSNTPKFNQVKGKGKIVKRSWLETCHSQRKRLPWRRFALDKADLNKDESEDEICELIDLPSTSTTKTAVQKNSRISDDDDCKAEGSDTEERIAKILAKKKQEDKQKKEVKTPTKKRDESPFKKKAETSPKNRADTPPKPKKKDEPAPLQISTDGDSTDEESLNGPINSKNGKTNTGSPKRRQPSNDQIETPSKREMKKTVEDDDDDETDEELLNVPKYNKEKTSNENTRVQTPFAKKTSPILKREVLMDVSDDDKIDEDSVNVPNKYNKEKTSPKLKKKQL
uniref:DNA repair protein XRCC1 isoform X1 n=2 Tax=Diabrotica virgifera virgifera TaxID=50390 RepID=A0A6P7FQT3_DIAVI